MTECPGAWVVTKYPDGTEVHAHPNHTDEDLARAESLGFENTEVMTLVHDHVHTAISVAVGLTRSPTLWGIAHDVPAATELADAEEALVLAFHRYVNLL